MAQRKPALISLCLPVFFVPLCLCVSVFFIPPEPSMLLPTPGEFEVRFRFVIAVLVLLAPLALSAQNRRPEAPPAQPTPRWPDGKPRFSAAPGEKGLWHPN